MSIRIIPIARKESIVSNVGNTEMFNIEKLDELIKQAEKNIGVLAKKTKMSERAKNQSLKYWYAKLEALKMRKAMLEIELKKQSKDSSIPSDKSGSD